MLHWTSASVAETGHSAAVRVFLALPLWCLGAILLACASAAGGSLEDGLEAYSRSDYASAMQALRPLADEGHAEAQRVLGLMYEKGLAVAKDDHEALRWYRSAARQGNSAAQAHLGLIYAFGYLFGSDVPTDEGEGAYWYRMAAEQGDAGAQAQLAMIYEHGVGVPRDYRQAHLWYQKAAMQAGPAASRAQHSLGRMYELGLGVAKDNREARHWYRLANKDDNYRRRQQEATTYIWIASAAATMALGLGLAWMRFARQQKEWVRKV